MGQTRDLASLAGETTIFGGFATEKVKRLQTELDPLSRRYDVVVANPPYMGSKNMNKWLGDWIKKHYKNVKGDLFSCFMVRNVDMGTEHAQLGFMTPYVWMFIGTYEKLRKFVIQQNTITSLIQLEYSGFSGATVPICTFTLQKGYCPGYRGGYVRLSDFVGADQQAPRALEALADPDCGWLYRVDAKGFEAIPGSPIAYWATTGIRKAFNRGTTLENTMLFKTGMVTGDNERFLRLWWETSRADQCVTAKSNEEAVASKKKWFPYNKGGEFRRWYGNNDYLVNFEDEGAAIFDTARRDGRAVTNMRSELRFRTTVTWSLISSALPAFRLKEYGFLYDKAGLSFYPPSKGDALYALGLCNSSFSVKLLQCLAPTLNFQLGDIWRIPYFVDRPFSSTVESLVEDNIALSRSDWDAFEESWNFKRHPII